MIPRLSSICVLLLLGGLSCGPDDPGNSNGNNNSNGNDNSGTGHTVEDLPDLSIDDTLGTGEGADVPVPGLILVGFDQTVSDDLLLQLADSTATALNGELVDVIPDIQVISIQVEEGGEAAAIALAERLESVAYAEADFAGRLAAISEFIPDANSTQFAQYQLFVTNAIKARSIAASGSGDITVAVLDSGCQLTHPEFAASAISAGANYVDRNSNVSDDVLGGGHGTGVTSLLAASVNSGQIAGLLPGFNVTVHKVCDSDGACPLDAAVLGIIGALSGNADLDISTTEIPPADVINISFSFSADYNSLARAIFEAESRGVVVVAAAGNNGRSVAGANDRFPAGYSTVVSVGATDIQDRAAPFSNRSSEVDVVAPGVDLLVASSNGAYRFVDGSSFAAAQVTAAAAWLLDRESALSTLAVRDRLRTRGDELTTGNGFAESGATKLNLFAALQDQDQPAEPFIIADSDLVDATGVEAETLVSANVGRSSSAVTPEAFTEEDVHWYGYFPGNGVTFELIDGDERRPITPGSLVPSSIDLFLEFVRGIDLGTVAASFGILQQAVFEVPDLGGERRALQIVAISGEIESEPRTFIYNPLQRGYNIISYKNFDSAILHLRDEEGQAFDADQADIRLLGLGPRPEINWTAGPANRVQLGSALDPLYFVASEAEHNDLSPPVRLGECVGEDVPEQLCGQAISLLERELARITVRIAESGGFRYATLDVIFVP